LFRSRSEPVAQPLQREPEHRRALVDVLPRLEARAQEHLLPALETRDRHRQGHRGGRALRGVAGRIAARHGRRRHRCRRARGRRPRVFARESRELRGLPVSAVTRPSRLLDPGLCLTLRPMAYPSFFERYRAAIRNTWTVEEVDFSTDLADLDRMSDAERHLVQRLVAFFATGDSIVANNLVLNLYR